MHELMHPPLVVPFLCRIKRYRIREGQRWPFFFQGCTGQVCSTTGCVGKKMGNKDFVWIRMFSTHCLSSVCLREPSLWFSCWSSEWQQNPTWKCHCIDYLRCGTAHWRGCGEDNKGQGQQTSGPGWLAAGVSFLFTLKLCVQPLSFPTA